MEIKDFDRQGVEVVECSDCGKMPKLEITNSVRLYLQCPKCKKKTKNWMFVMEAADEWEDINE
jgi:phage FluMu protein Com